MSGMTTDDWKEVRNIINSLKIDIKDEIKSSNREIKSYIDGENSLIKVEIEKLQSDIDIVKHDVCGNGSGFGHKQILEKHEKEIEDLKKYPETIKKERRGLIIAVWAVVISSLSFVGALVFSILNIFKP